MTTLQKIIDAYGERAIPLTAKALVLYRDVMVEYVYSPRPGLTTSTAGICLYALSRLDGFSAWGVWNAMLTAGVETVVEWNDKRIQNGGKHRHGRTPERIEMVKALIADVEWILKQAGVTVHSRRKDEQGEENESGVRARTSEVQSSNNYNYAGNPEGSGRVVSPDQLCRSGCGEGVREGEGALREGSGQSELDADAGKSLPSPEGAGEQGSPSIVTDTLKQAKADWREVIHGDGGNCPVCERWGKVYARNLNKTMAISLQWLYTAQKEAGDPRTWIDVPNTAPKHVLRTNQLATLRWWGLIERKPEDLEDKTQKHTGFWRITLKGMDFVEGKVLVPKTVETYNAEVVGYGKELINFRTALGIKFDYSQALHSVSSTDMTKLFPEVVA